MRQLIHRLRFLVHPLCLLCAAGVLAALVVYRHAYTVQPNQQPQPVPFSHHTHTAEHMAGMPCLQCHRGAEQSSGAGMPTSTSCLDCHRHILRTDPRLLPLHAAANPDSPVYTAEPLAWVRRAPLPAYVHFHHGRHAAAGISCAECHPTPDTPTPHTMSSCLECHRRHQLPTDCDACHH